MENGWNVVLCILFLAACLSIGTILKLNIKLFQKHLMPTAMISGFIGLIILTLSESVFKIIDSQTINNIRRILVFFVYHLTAVGFISLALKDRNSKRGKDIFNTGMFIVNTYMVQAFIGLGISVLLGSFFYKDIFEPFGLMLPLGFAQGPGQTASIGLKWKDIIHFSGNGLAFPNGLNIGLSIATIGFLWALIGGVPFMNLLLRKRYNNNKKYKISEVTEMAPDTNIERTTTVPKKIHIDDLTMQLMLIGSVYIGTYLLLIGFEKLFYSFGGFFETVADMLWGFHFMVGTVLALALRTILDKIKKTKKDSVKYPDNYLLTKISSASFDFIIVASITAISLTSLKEYLVPIIILTSVGGLFTMLYTYRICKWVYNKEQLEHTVALYGMWTGTITTGMALLREIDPHNKSSVPEHLVLGSGLAIFMGFPLMIILGIPIHGYKTGQTGLFYTVTFCILGLFIALFSTLLYLNRNNKNKINH